MGFRYGYVRVSSKDQNEDRQMLAMYKEGIEKKRIYIDKQSGKDFNRPSYIKLLKKLKEGDVLYLHSIDRLGRNYEEILNQWSYLTRVLKVDIIVLDMPLLNTQRRNGDLTGVFISDLVLQILSYVAQVERDNIKKRQAEGIAAAKQRGVHCGRSKKQLPDDFEEVVCKWRHKQCTGQEAAQVLGVSRTYLYKYAKEYGLM